ncbi:MAG: hypothetical protein ACTSO9_21745 [Candidatus Helarchaeota archaeon]
MRITIKSRTRTKGETWNVDIFKGETRPSKEKWEKYAAAKKEEWEKNIKRN